MKRCGKCGVEKPLADFNRKGAGVGAWCRSCHAEWYRANRDTHGQHARANTARYRERNRELVRAYLLDHPCVDCGEADPLVLDFDHVRGPKLGPVSRLVGQPASVAVLVTEIAKCEVRCANCHRRVTAARAGTWGWHESVARTEGVEPSIRSV